MVGAVWAARLVSMVGVVVLARLVTPEDFGIVAIATAYVGIVSGLTLINTTQALIALREPTASAYDTAFTLGVIRGVLIAILMVGSAPLVALAMTEPRVTAVIAVLSVNPILQGLANPRLVDFQRRLVFSREAALQVAPTMVSLGLVVAIAVVYQSYWALVVGSVAENLIRLVLGHLLLRYRPKISFADTRYIFGFAGWLTGSGILRTISIRFDSLWVGGVLGTSVAGIYHVGNELTNTLGATVGAPLNKALYPALALLAGDPGRLREKTLETMSALAMVTLPIGVGFALLAEDIVLVALGEQWMAAALLVQWLAPVAAFQIVSNLADSVAMCRNETRRVFVRDLAYFFVRVGTMVPAIFIAGFVGVVVARAVSGALLTLANFRLACRMLGTPLYRVPLAFWRSIVATVVMVGAVMAAQSALPELSPAALMATKFCVGAVVYVAVHLGTWFAVGRPRGAEVRALSLTVQLLHRVVPPSKAMV